MFIAGVINPTSNDLFHRICEVVSNKEVFTPEFYENEFIKVIISKAPPTIDQGTIIKSKNRLLVGKVFTKSDYRLVEEKDIDAASFISNKKFVRDYWGTYLLFDTRNDQNSVSILRDPVGQLPLFYTKLSSGDILFASHIEIIHKVKKEVSFNTSYLLKFILNTQITSEYTAFKDIYELPHGCQLTIRRNNAALVTSVIWNPLDYCSGYKGSSKTQEELILTLTKVLECWTQNAKGSFLDFSGGTDSTALLFLLKKIFNSNQILKAVNFYHPQVSASDERKHAIKIAQEANVDLILFDKSQSDIFDPTEDKPLFKPNWPTPILARLKQQEALDKITKQHENLIYMSGHGGDHAFMCPAPIASLCDYLLIYGVKGFFEKLKELSGMRRMPLFPILKHVFLQLFYFYLPKTYDFFDTKDYKISWLENNNAGASDQFSHPFFKNKKCKNVLPGKWMHIEAIYRGLATIKSDIRDKGTNPVFYPFFSQPIIELALAIPTYESYSMGYNRYIFRKAISDTFNTSSVWRRDKGETSGVTQKSLFKKEMEIRKMCTEGLMAKEKLINIKLISSAIKRMGRGEKDNQWPIMNLACVEEFIKIWNQKK
jgi:asparagine synthase (glutamine-hydrolysing)